MNFIHECVALIDEHGTLRVRNGEQAHGFLLTQPLMIVFADKITVPLHVLTATFQAVQEAKAKAESNVVPLNKEA